MSRERWGAEEERVGAGLALKTSAPGGNWGGGPNMKS